MTQVLDPIFDRFAVLTESPVADVRQARRGPVEAPSLVERALAHHPLGPSGLGRQHRADVRRVVELGAFYLLSKPPSVHYTQTAERWNAIEHKHILVFQKQRGVIRAVGAHGVFPFYSDCSATDTWLLWLGLHHYIGSIRKGRGVRDVVNGTGWTSGYTGTMFPRGVPVKHPRNYLVGDQAFYGGSGDVPEHVTTFLGFRNSRPVVFSHGSDPGPFLLDMHYRPDFREVRRYV